MSITIGTSYKTEIPALKALWKEAFGDDDACIDLFFDTAYAPEGVFVVREDDAVQAMACYFPVTICAQQRGWSAAYLYAVATDKGARGRGFCGRLLRHAEEFLAPRGVKALLLVPGAPSLREFYMRYGFSPFSTVCTREGAAIAVEAQAEEISPPEYLMLREEFLAARGYVSSPVPMLEFQARMAKLYGGALLRLPQGGCACVAKDGDGRAVIYELLSAEGEASDASLAAQTVGASCYTARMPGESEPFAMVKWLTTKPELPPIYLGIALD